MLTTARPIFQNVPASYADPVGLAGQQGAGVVSLISVRYEPGDGQEHDALGPFYDSYVAVSGQLLAVARTTADYRYPVTPAVGLARFIEHRDSGSPAFLSVYELDEEECARFVETVFYSECLKLHVDGSTSATLVAQQIVRSECGDGLPSGILEINDFSQPGEPRIRLVDLDTLATVSAPSHSNDAPHTVDPVSQAGIGPLAAVLADHLDGVDGRVLLYDRAKNRAAMPHRAGKPFDLDAAIEQAGRLADARRSGDPAQAARQATVTAAHLRTEAPPDQVEAVETYLRDTADNPGAVAPGHPHHTGLAALVAELQGGPPAQPFTGLAETDGTEGAPAAGQAGPEPVGPGGDSQAAPQAGHPPGGAPTRSEPALPIDASAVATTHETPQPPTESVTLPPPAEPSVAEAAPAADARTPATASSPIPHPDARHVLATELDVLRAGVYAVFEDAVGRDKAVAHEQHVLDEHDIASPVAPQDTVGYLRVLLCDNPPRRWHGFKRARGKTYGDVCSKLLAFHTANAHVDGVVVHEVGQLWARLCT